MYTVMFLQVRWFASLQLYDTIICYPLNIDLDRGFKFCNTAIASMSRTKFWATGIDSTSLELLKLTFWVISPQEKLNFFVSLFYTWPDLWNIYVHTKFSILINYSFYWIWKIYNCVNIFSTPDVDMLHSACSVCTLCLILSTFS